MADKYEFPTCLHYLAAAMHMQNIDPSDVTITLPRDKWWSLQCSIERHMRGFMMYDGRQPELDGFRYMGFLFKPANL